MRYCWVITAKHVYPSGATSITPILTFSHKGMAIEWMEGFLENNPQYEWIGKYQESLIFDDIYNRELHVIELTKTEFIDDELYSY